ncbi:MAG: hypothetical protein HOU81_02175 [Hamadaea sp.]|uniref:hypothetical protein n=1 Tax=Hamadaea sp. TaxID=2024425 RepID=UPI00179D77D7|nr:hypothetical protein [Hamadaea sp.]NUR69604.1 hypothetical protein [Hamadaea sp.]NUT20284.1 hypothetical protein [Hamadaea sp.]
MTKNLRRILMLGAVVLALGGPLAGAASAGEYDWDQVPADSTASAPVSGAAGPTFSVLAEYDWD